jgi:glycosyltransferase involved in cell wall biosynthesis
MDFLNRLNAFNNTNNKPKQSNQENLEKIKQERIDKVKRSEKIRLDQEKEAIKLQKEKELSESLETLTEENRPKVSFVMTACGRPDLMEETLDSFFKFNTYPIERYIITEDSMDPQVFDECNRLNREKYNNKLEFVFNNPKLGQSKSIDLAYNMIDTEYIFHCEEDWEFYDDEFIEQSLSILKADSQVLQVWIRPKTDRILNDIKPDVYYIDGIGVRDVLPKSFMVKGALPNGKDLIVRDYMGFSWNPGLKRMSDYNLLKNGYSGFNAEHMIDAFYRSHKNNYKVVSLSESDDQGFVKHIGWNRRADDPIYNEDKDSPQDLETAMLEARKKREEDKKKAEELKAKNQATEKTKVLTPKISVVMQVYLGDYPGSRTDSTLKFHRAVKSFLDQKYNKAELIIVSDGCKIVEEHYYKYYADKENVKYAYVDKTGLPNMYHNLLGGKKYYRGVPRQVGVAMADGGLITYMDSDDFLHPEFLYRIIIAHNKQPDAKWLMNDTWLDHENITKMQKVDAIEDHAGKTVYNIPFLNAKFIETKVKDGLIVNTPWLLTHVNNITVKWEDSFEGISEDVMFARKLREAYKGLGARFSAATYLRCHYTGLWDV